MSLGVVQYSEKGAAIMGELIAAHCQYNNSRCFFGGGMTQHSGVQVYPDSEALSHAAARFWVEAAAEAIVARGAFLAALSGGSTPQRLYQLLATTEYARQVDWDKVYLFFTDERAVAQDHEDSNYRMVQQALLDHVPLPARQIHAMNAAPEHLAQGVREYQAWLDTQVPKSMNGFPQFDLIFLGMGEDGHTASLFPGTQALQEQQAWVVANEVKQLAAWRMTLTYPVLNHARNVLFLVSGKAKAKLVAEVLQGHGQSLHYPVQAVQPLGDLFWFLDRDAASELPHSEALFDPGD